MKESPAGNISVVYQTGRKQLTGTMAGICTGYRSSFWPAISVRTITLEQMVRTIAPRLINCHNAVWTGL